MSSGNIRNTARTIGVTSIAFACTCAWPQAAATKLAVPLDPIDGIMAAFKTHQLVTLGEGGHNNEQTHALCMALIRGGTPRYDRFGRTPRRRMRSGMYRAVRENNKTSGARRMKVVDQVFVTGGFR